MAELIGRSNMPHSRLTAFCVSGCDRNLSAFLTIVRRERASVTRSFILFASSSIYSYCQNVFLVLHFCLYISFAFCSTFLSLALHVKEIGIP